MRAFAANLKRRALALGGLLAWCVAGLACSVGSDAAPGNDDGGGNAIAASGRGNGAGTSNTVGTNFMLRPEFSGACTRANSIDVNLGNSAEAFVRAAYCQVNGSEPSADVVDKWVSNLKSKSFVRRIDVVLGFCNAAARNCGLSYSDPWQVQSDLSTPCVRSGTRDMGAVLMFFNSCPGGVNCEMNWANTHASGMSGVSPLLGFAPNPAGIYGPQNPGFWRRELLDAAYAGVQFFLLNVYGPDLYSQVDPLAQLDKALEDTGNVVKVGLFDDTDSWGKGGNAKFAVLPNFNQPEQAAQAIYDAKWKPFFSRIPKASWYLVDNRPLIYFYNAGTLKPTNISSKVVAALRAKFEADFGVWPFIVVDEAFFADPDMSNVADGRFNWDTFRTGQISEQTVKGVRIDHFMPKWDALGRDRKGQIASANDRIVKDDALLKMRLQESAGSQITTIATWNDMGEGTGITRNYDYFADGNWLEPDVFLKDIRAVQCAN